MAKESVLTRVPLPAKAGIIVVALALVGVAYWVVFYGDIAQKIEAAGRREDSLKADLAKAKQAEIAYQKDLAELHEREQRRSEVEKILPIEAQYPAFLSSVQNVANISGIELVAWTPELEVKEEFYARVPMKLKLSGRFHRVAKFFEAASQLDRVINMENISITSPKESGEEIRVQVDVQATAFRSLGEDEAAAPSGGRQGRAAAGRGKKK